MRWMILFHRLFTFSKCSNKMKNALDWIGIVVKPFVCLLLAAGCTQQHTSISSMGFTSYVAIIICNFICNQAGPLNRPSKISTSNIGLVTFGPLLRIQSISFGPFEGTWWSLSFIVLEEAKQKYYEIQRVVIVLTNRRNFCLFFFLLLDEYVHRHI